MRVEHEWSYTQGEHGYPEVDQVGNPDGQADIEKNDQVSHAHVNAGSCKSGVQDAEIESSGGKTTSCCDVSCSTESQIAQNRLRVDLGGEHLKDGRK